MGEALFFGGKDKNDAKNDNDDGQRIEQDVREALSSMGLPLSSEGARAALVKVGRWSSGSGDATKGGGGGGGNNNKRNILLPPRQSNHGRRKFWTKLNRWWNTKPRGVRRWCVPVSLLERLLQDGREKEANPTGRQL